MSAALMAQPSAGAPPVAAPAVERQENFRVTIPFSRIPENGDPRIKKILERFRSSSLGEQAYQYAVRKNLRFRWNKDSDSNDASYNSWFRRINVDSSISDDEIISTLSHEIRHAWQYNTLRVHRWRLNPDDHWRMNQFIEADSCAFNAHFVAAHHQATGEHLFAFSAFSNRITNTYLFKVPERRNYVEDALAPCFDEVRSSYREKHMKRVGRHYRAAARSYERALETRDYSGALRHRFNIPDDQKRASLFSGFMNLTLDPKQRMPGYQDQTFLDWLARQTVYHTDADRDQAAALQAGFESMRKHLIKLDKNRP